MRDGCIGPMGANPLPDSPAVIASSGATMQKLMWDNAVRLYGQP